MGSALACARVALSCSLIGSGQARAAGSLPRAAGQPLTAFPAARVDTGEGGLASAPLRRGPRLRLRGSSSGVTIPRSPRSVLREDVISSLHDRVAGEAALGVVSLRRLVRERAGRERVGGGVVGEHGPAPSAAVGEALA